MKKFNDWFGSLSPKAKKTFVFGIAGAIFLLFTLKLYKDRQPQTSLATAPVKAVAIDPDLLHKTELSESRRKVEEMGDALEKLQGEQKAIIDRLKSQNTAPTPGAAPSGSGAPAPGTRISETAPLPYVPDAAEVESKVHAPPAPGQPGPQAGQQQIPPGTQQRQEKRTLGEITVVSNPVKAETQKPKERTVYLPPSFMSAILLTGLDAGTSNNGKANPDPLLLRVQTPAVLPNDVKANLAGCFVVGEGQGRLDKERVDVRLVSLSCLTKEGSAVIDTPIKGFVTDADAKTGLAGHVVSRMGASVARSLVAGFFQGAGEMMKTQATTTSVSGLGAVSTVNPSQVGSYAVGSGLSAGSQRLADFYLTLAKQATPVIEANADKHVTVVISEGKELVIKDLPQQDDDLTNNNEE